MNKVLSRKRAFDLLDKFSGAKVLVIGDLMIDHFIWGSVSRISPEAPVPVVEVARENLLLGGSGNVLNNIIAMGGQAYLSGVIGKDSMGKWLVEKLKESRVDTEGLIIENGRPTTVKTRIVAHNQQMVRFDRESKKKIAPASLQKILNHVAKIKNEIHVIVVSDYNKGVVSEALLKGIREITIGSSIAICVDPKQNDFSIYRGADVITPNHHEAARAMGLEQINGSDAPSEDEIGREAMACLKNLDSRALLITRGEEGMSLFEKDGKRIHIPTVAKEVFDVTGAGDTVIGVFALSLAAGASFKEAAVLANYAAGIVVGKIGTATVTREEFQRVL
jgi:D-beta-D-heptose 7-phosphate kinase/D-beta-D-heptose 1-phosphate adenosyltransferase